MIVVVAIVTAGWIVLRVWKTPGPASTGTPGTTDAAAPWGDDALAVGPVEAYARGVALVDSGLSVASLPYLARAVSAPGAPWQAWRAYASALHNVAMSAVTEPSAEGEAAPRSSFERIRMERMALERLDRAEVLTQANEDRAIVRLTRGQFLRTWGFPWDALQELPPRRRDRRTVARHGALLREVDARPAAPRFALRAVSPRDARGRS